MKLKTIAVFLTALLAGMLTALGVVGATTAMATGSGGGNECVEHEGYYQRYSWTGGPHGSDDPPAFPSDDWQANVKGDPHNVGQSGAYYRSHGGSGKGDWFFLDWIDPVFCEEPTETPTPTPTETTPEPTPTETVTPTPEPTETVTPTPTPVVTPPPSNPPAATPPVVTEVHTPTGTTQLASTGIDMQGAMTAAALLIAGVGLTMLARRKLSTK